MTISPNFKIKKLSAIDFKDAEIVDVSANRSYGRRFKLKIGDVESKEYILSDIYKRVQKLSKKPCEAFEKNGELNSLKTFLDKLKEADTTAEIAYSRRDNWYKFRTWFHRIFDFGSHSKKIDKLNSAIQKKIMDVDEVLEEIQIILDAAKLGDAEAIKQLALANTNFNVRGKEGTTPLGLAAFSGQIEAMKCLIDAGADINMLSDSEGGTPLFMAVINDELEAMKLLLEHDGIEINQQNLKGETALMMASALGNEKAVNALLQSEKIQVNLATPKGYTALMFAASQGHKEIVQALLQSEKIQIHLEDSQGYTAMMFAASHGQKEMVKLLRTVMQPDAFLIQKEKLKLTVLSNSTSIEGVSKVMNRGGNVIYVDLEGVWPPYIVKKMHKASKDFTRYFPDLIGENESAQFLDVFKTSLKPSNDVAMERIEKGLPVFWDTGYPGHAVTVMAWGPYFFLCNKGESGRKLVEVFQYDPTKLNQEILNKFKVGSLKNDKAYEAYFFQELPQALDFQPQQEFEKAFEAMCDQLLKSQTAGNCAWASPETAVFCYFALQVLLGNVDGKLNLDVIPSTISDQQVQQISQKFYTWLSFVQMYQLEGYLGAHVIRLSNDDKAARHAQRRKALVLDYSVLIAAIKEIEANSKKTIKSAKIADLLKQTLAKAIALTANESLTEQHTQVAQEILDSIGTITPDEIKAKFEQSI